MGFTNLSNGNAIIGEATTDASGVGGRATAAFIDEFSRFKDGDKVLSGTADVTNCRVFNFTPFGQGAAKKLAARKDVRKLRLHWSEHPEKARGLYQYCKERRKRFYLDPTGFIHDPDYPFVDDGKLRSPWYDEECRRRANTQEIAQNLDIDWGGSSYQFFEAEMIGDLQRTLCCKPYVMGELLSDPDTAKPQDWITRDNGPVRLWMNLDAQGRPPGRKFSVGCDVSLGTGATNSCCSAFDLVTGEKVLEFATPFLRADAFASKVVAICRWLQSPEGEGAYLGWEMQGPGIMFGKRVIELGYRHVYYRTNENSLAKQISDTPGWTPTPDNKRVLLEEYRTGLASKACVNRSYEALEECLAMIHLPNGMVEHTGALETEDPTGARANHGDRVIADAIGWKLCRERQVARGKVKEEVKPGSLAWRRDEREQARKRELAWA